VSEPALYRAILAGEPYPPPGVEDTEENRQAYDEIVAWLEQLPPGRFPEIPWDYTEMPDDG